MKPRLHLLCSPHADAWRDCLGQLADGDGLLLLDRGVECLLDEMFLTLLRDRPAVRWQVLRADAQARGLVAEARDRLVDDAGWVRLVEAHAQVLSWS